MEIYSNSPPVSSILPLVTKSLSAEKLPPLIFSVPPFTPQYAVSEPWLPSVMFTVPVPRFSFCTEPPEMSAVALSSHRRESSKSFTVPPVICTAAAKSSAFSSSTVPPFRVSAP